jgi:hypothetical protein
MTSDRDLSESLDLVVAELADKAAEERRAPSRSDAADSVAKMFLPVQ